VRRYPSTRPVKISNTRSKFSVTVTVSPLAKVMVVPPVEEGLRMNVCTCRTLMQRSSFVSAS
jgi:hypothetical protein